MKNSVIALLFYLFCIPPNAFAQSPAADSAIFSSSLANAIRLYHQFLTPEKGLFNGRQYAEYASEIKEGIPYFESKEFIEGSVLYDGVLFEHVPMLYDILVGVVIIKDADGVYWLQLNNDKITSFTLQNHLFIRVATGSGSDHTIKPGFYELLHNGRSSLLKKQTKTVQDEVVVNGIKKFIVNSTSFYVKKNKGYYSVNSKSSVLDVFKDRKKEIEKFIKINKLNFRKAKESALIKIIEYYNGISPL